ncbi:M23 family metallopeptidase [Pseudoalteromonas sp. MMG022]|uniref:M23 family metallopeptidase n=1 Tax=Pseudoalteromonas sp. MMG022 TaxID=2909978 RepID=UPI0023B33748|nr:M23 family metallopeptidase [Pseudoalteromonas sp. MMG022]
MKNTSTLLLLSALSASGTVVAQGQDSHVNDFSFSGPELAALPTYSIQLIDEQSFLFNNTLQSYDWDSFFLSYAPHLADKKEVILHWAGYSSINPKLLIALMEQQSQVVSAPTKQNLNAPFATLSSRTGFNSQIEDIALMLSKRYYAYLELSEKLNVQDAPSTNAATVALISLLQKQPNGVSKIIAQYNQLFDGDSLQLHADSQVKTAKPSNFQAQAAFSMQLPWPSGYAWYSGGAHSNTGSGYPYSSLDFNNGSGGWGSNTPWVQASHGGTVTRYSSCNIRVTHSSGYATQYYHMDNLQYQTGDVISPGAWLGRYASNRNQALCQGGSSTGPHVHFSLLSNGRFISLHNWYISGYRIDVGNSNYDTNCWNFYFEKNGYKTCAWNPLYR